mmetsp:Transcript_31782/g.62942  ORF Transcript_31782/g.62942 Transcript_31782/m.62942 type:complete len:115 (-) Transcript_31782:149-493(-)
MHVWVHVLPFLQLRASTDSAECSLESLGCSLKAQFCFFYFFLETSSPSLVASFFSIYSLVIPRLSSPWLPSVLSFLFLRFFSVLFLSLLPSKPFFTSSVSQIENVFLDPSILKK